MGDYVDSEWRKHAERSGLSNKITKHRIEKCSDPHAWYVNMVGQIVSVHHFSTFGAWTPEGKWFFYYDLSSQIEENENIKPTSKKTKGFITKLFGR